MPLSHTNKDAYGPIYYLTRPALFYTPVASYTIKVLKMDPIAYWIQGEASGLVSVDQVDSPAQDGTYQGVTLGQPGIGDGNTCPFYDGVNDVTDIYSATFDAAFDGDEGSILLWANVANAGVWTDGNQRVAFRLRTNAPGYFMFSKEVAANTFRIDRFIGASKGANIPTTSTDWMHLGITWSRTADEVRVYYNGAQSGATANGLAAWAGASTNTQFCIGASTTAAALPFYGHIAHVAVWDRPLDPDEVADLYIIH